MEENLEEKTSAAAHSIVNSILQKITKEKDSVAILLDFIVHIEAFTIKMPTYDSSNIQSSQNDTGETKEDKSVKKNILIRDLGFTTKVYNSLTLYGHCTTIEDILKLGKRRVKDLPFAGREAYKEIVEKLSLYEFEFGRPYSFKDPKDISVEEMSFSNEVSNRLVRANCLYLKDILEKSSHEIMQIKHIGRGCLEEIKEKVEIYGYKILK
ncbi:MAG: DNA-directed RNA polymerase subunit alpha C-terminal domain-containing protein [Candidatus Gracilibacteria bacterium]